MNKTLIFCAAAVTTLTLSGGSLMPEKGKISIHGADGASFQKQGEKLILKREKTPVNRFLRGLIRFHQNLDGNPAPDDALVLELKTEKDVSIRTRWNGGGNLPEYAIKGKKEFQEVILPMPESRGKKLTALDLQFTPDPGRVEIRKIEIAKPRKVTLKADEYPTKIQKEITFRGMTATPETEVTVSIRNAEGKVQSKTIRSKNGKYELVWKRPPVSEGQWNTAYAQIGSGKNSAETSIPLSLFGYRADDEFAWIRVKGRHFMTSPLSRDGEQKFIPVGIGYCRDVIIPAQDEEVMKFCKARHLNTIRLSFYTRFFNNNEKAPLEIEEHIRDFILPVVLAAKRHNMYVILDDHGYFTAKIDEAKARQSQSVPRWSDAGFQEWIRRWVKVAEFFKNEPTVLGYELLNEPHDISPEATRMWYTRCLKAIRAVDQRHAILVGNSDWSHARAMEKTWGPVATTVDAPYNNVAFTFHDYPDDNHPWEVAKSITTFRDKYNVPVLCTEFGATHWSKTETVCRMFIAGMLTLFAKEDVGWMIWALKRLEDNPRGPWTAPKWDSCSYSDFWIPAARITASPTPKAK